MLKLIILLYYEKIKYIIFKNYYEQLLNNNFLEFMLKIFIFIDYVEHIIYYIRRDMSNLILYIKEKKKMYYNFGFIRHVLFIFFLIMGFIPFIMVLHVIFYFTKHLFKYILFTIDFFFNVENNKYFEQFSKIIIIIFEDMPNYVKLFYRFLFKKKWVSIFKKYMKNYFINKKNNILKKIFKSIDHFFLIYAPRKFIEIQDKLIDWYYLTMIFYIRKKKKIRKFIYFLKHKQVRARYKWRFLLKKKNRPYKIVYYKYKQILFFLIWLKKFIFSDVCKVTIHAFFIINYLNVKATFIYIFIYSFQMLENKYVRVFYYFLMLYYEICFYIRFFNVYAKYYIWNSCLYYLYALFYLFVAYLDYAFFWVLPIVFHYIKAWIIAKGNLFTIEQANYSLMWWNLKFYAVIAKFFVRLEPTELGTFIFDWKFKRVMYYLQYEHLFLRWHDLFWQLYYTFSARLKYKINPKNWFKKEEEYE